MNPPLLYAFSCGGRWCYRVQRAAKSAMGLVVAVAVLVDTGKAGLALVVRAAGMQMLVLAV